MPPRPSFPPIVDWRGGSHNRARARAASSGAGDRTSGSPGPSAGCGPSASQASHSAGRPSSLLGSAGTACDVLPSPLHSINGGNGSEKNRYNLAYFLGTRPPWRILGDEPEAFDLLLDPGVGEAERSSGLGAVPAELL